MDEPKEVPHKFMCEDAEGTATYHYDADEVDEYLASVREVLEAAWKAMRTALISGFNNSQTREDLISALRLIEPFVSSAAASPKGNQDEGRAREEE